MSVKTVLRQSNLKFQPEKPGIISVSLTLACSILKSLSSDLISLAIRRDEDGWCQIPLNSNLLEVKAEGMLGSSYYG